MFRKRPHTQNATKTFWPKWFQYIAEWRIYENVNVKSLLWEKHWICCVRYLHRIWLVSFLFSAGTAGQHLHTTDSEGKSCPAEERKHHYNSYAKKKKKKRIVVNLLICTQVAGVDNWSIQISPAKVDIGVKLQKETAINFCSFNNIHSSMSLDVTFITSFCFGCVVLHGPFSLPWPVV